MKRAVICVALGGLFVLLTGLASLAQQDWEAEVADSFRSSFPQVQFQQIMESPMEGIYEIIAGNRIFYYAPATEHLLVGELWSKAGKSLTKARLGELMGKRIKDLPLDKALKIGSGPKTVIEVTDPDCPFCREASKFFKGRTDTTRYVFFMPLSMHPDAEQKVRYILSSEKPVEAYETIMAGEMDDFPLPEFQDNGLFETHRMATEQLGVQSTPNFWVNGVYVPGADFKTITELLK